MAAGEIPVYMRVGRGTEHQIGTITTATGAATEVTSDVSALVADLLEAAAAEIREQA